MQCATQTAQFCHKFSYWLVAGFLWWKWKYWTVTLITSLAQGSTSVSSLAPQRTCPRAIQRYVLGFSAVLISCNQLLRIKQPTNCFSSLISFALRKVCARATCATRLSLSGSNSYAWKLAFLTIVWLSHPQLRTPYKSCLPFLICSVHLLGGHGHAADLYWTCTSYNSNEHW